MQLKWFSIHGAHIFQLKGHGNFPAYASDASASRNMAGPYVPDEIRYFLQEQEKAKYEPETWASRVELGSLPATRFSYTTV